MSKLVTEGRVAILISLASAAFAYGQWREATRANQFNEENISIDIQQNDDPTNRIGSPTCSQNTASIPLTWRVSIFNNSAQPVTLAGASYMGYSVAGTVIPLDPISLHGPVSRPFPRTVAARGYDTLVVTVPVNAPQPFVAWLHASGHCNRSSETFRQEAAQAGFSPTGASNGSPSNASVLMTFRTGGGQIIQRAASWGPM